MILSRAKLRKQPTQGFQTNCNPFGTQIIKSLLYLKILSRFILLIKFLIKVLICTATTAECCLLIPIKQSLLSGSGSHDTVAGGEWLPATQYPPSLYKNITFNI